MLTLALMAAVSVAHLGPAPAAAAQTTAEIVAKSEPSVALIKGRISTGTGFLVRPGIVVTNAHVVGGEFLSQIEVRFPSAQAAKQGPLKARLIHEDGARDLAFLEVATDLPPLDLAGSYTFRKGDDITVIGNPGLGDKLVLENAVSKGIMSSKAVIEGMNYHQLGIAINPGNSGGPVFDSSGKVIGVATLKAARQEGLAFCIPVEDLNAAIAKLGRGPASTPSDFASRHNADAAFQILTSGGALYALALEIRGKLVAAKPPGAAGIDLLPADEIRTFHGLVTELDQKAFSQVDPEMPAIRSDSAIAPTTRENLAELLTSFHAMKDLYANPDNKDGQYLARVRAAKARHLKLVQALQGDFKSPIPAGLLALYSKEIPDGQAAGAIAGVLPPRYQSRIAGRMGLSSAASRAQDARDRMQNLRDRARGGLRARGRR